MTVRRAAEVAVTVLLVVFVVSMVAGQVLGQPILLGYVTSDSMEPTISEGDGIVVVPAFLTGPPEEGDIVVFHAKALNDGGITTHRVAGKTEEGYITKGDNNPFTDQDSDEPPVTEGQIIGIVPQVNGQPLVIPHFGTAIEGLRGLLAAPITLLGEDNAGPVLVTFGVALFLLAGFSGGVERTKNRTRSRENVIAARVLVLVAVVLVAGTATIAMTTSSGVYDFGLVSTDNPSSEPQVVRPGATTEWTYETQSTGLMPMLIITEPASENVEVSPGRTTLSRGDTTEVTVRSTAPEEQGTYVRSVRESRYYVLLPPAVIVALHDVHPLVALLAVDLVIAVFVVALSLAVFGTGLLRVRSDPGHIPVRIRLRRQLRRFR